MVLLPLFLLDRFNNKNARVGSHHLRNGLVAKASVVHGVMGRSGLYPPRLKSHNGCPAELTEIVVDVHHAYDLLGLDRGEAQSHRRVSQFHGPLLAFGVRNPFSNDSQVQTVFNLDDLRDVHTENPQQSFIMTE